MARYVSPLLALAVAGAPLSPALAQAPAEACVARDPVTAEINAREGIRLAKDGNFEAAEALFMTATALDPCVAKYPYLLGRAHDRQDDLQAAATAYQSVIDRFPTSVEYTKAQGALIKLQVRLKALEAQAAEEKAAKEEARRQAQADAEREAREAEQRALAAEARRVAKAARKAREAERMRLTSGDPGIGGQSDPDDMPWATVGWLTAGLGLVALGAGIGFSLAAQDADDELALAATRPDRARYDDLVDQRETFSTIGYAGYGVGAALVLGGLTLVLVDEAPAPAVAPTEGGAVVGLSGRF